jgi:16S rRNA (guanine(527)-N(7))-methyltransferase RsmG
MKTDSQKSGRQPGPEALAALFNRCGVDLTGRQIEQFWIYHELLRRHNTVLNLTRIHNFENMVLKLYVDSVLPAQLTALPSPLMDLGSGPGMPGIPLKIMRPDLEIWLAEGRAKRAAFLKEAVDALQLAGIRIIDRKISPRFDEPVAGVITRAVETMEETAGRVDGCLQQNGRLIFMKGPGCDAEIELLQQRFDKSFSLAEDRSYRIGTTRHHRRLVVWNRLDAPARVRIQRAAGRLTVLPVKSEHNSRYKGLKKLLSSRGIKKAQAALMCGARPIHEMLARCPERCLSWIGIEDRQPPPETAPGHLTWIQLSEPLFKNLDIFGTDHPLLGIRVPSLAPWTPGEEFPPGCSLLVPFQDPENIGAAIRSAAAFGVAQVILLSESAHPYHPKALRTSGGAVPYVRMRQGPSLSDLPEDLPVLALSAEGTNLSEIEFPEAFGLLLGLEGQGLPDKWRRAAVRIPIKPEVESLNAAAAAAVALYEWTRRVSLYAQ